MNNKNDARTLRTKESLRDSLNMLIKEKSFHSITVLEVVEKADINRSTFYLHYNSIYHLLGDCLLNGWSYRRKVIALESTEDVLEDIKQNVQETLEYLLENRALAIVALEEMNSSNYMIWVRDLLFSHLTVWQEDFEKRLDEQTSTVLNEFIVNGVLGLYIWWLKSDTNNVDENFVEQCALMIMSIYSRYYID